jgi:hypothetical protein
MKPCSPVLLPVYRVHWLRAKAKFDRAQEQYVLLPYEMDWTLAYFRNRADVWSCRQEVAAGTSGGHESYAARQVAMWRAFERQAVDHFSKVRHST